ncbi:MAG: hemerythrin family protein [Candidatus Accumulibacter sp.]|uniref:bacteriohemerythrin n=1 Tax=Accumulibacter sp. TaxID=2053492 RepID=UPI001A4A0D75|nr:bacteriohemerythrin [Accumulibacter sp.]MBL8393080.1 hemerythrin family protein [Accumulibacter sp.]HRD86913.1 bacteriohemerythrin [Accumulibacter sp.]
MSATDLIQWSDEFSVNIQEVDEQHKVLVSLLNDLHRAIREHHGKATSREILDRLAEYTRTHFLLEESLMRLTHYPGLEIHKQQHQDLMHQVEALQHKLNTENAAISFELLHFLRNWLIQHINDSDKRFGVHFEKVGLATYAHWSKDVERTMKKKKWWWKFW